MRVFRIGTSLTATFCILCVCTGVYFTNGSISQDGKNLAHLLSPVYTTKQQQTQILTLQSPRACFYDKVHTDSKPSSCNTMQHNATHCNTLQQRYIAIRYTNNYKSPLRIFSTEFYVSQKRRIVLSTPQVSSQGCVGWKTQSITPSVPSHVCAWMRLSGTINGLSMRSLYTCVCVCVRERERVCVCVREKELDVCLVL